MKYDSIVIGSGQAGNPLAQKLVERGEKVALIERAQLGGTCVNTGCTPTKTMISSAAVAHYAREGARWGVHMTGLRIDLPEILLRKNKVVESSRSSWQKMVDKSSNLHLYRGSGVFSGRKELAISGEAIEGERIFINTGASSAIPKISGLESVDYLTNASLLELAEVPRHLLVLGGGYIGLEFGQMFRRLGSEVTVVQSGGQILPREDADVAATLQKSLEEEGVKFFLKARATKVDQEGSNVQLHLDRAEGATLVTGSHLLVATGRKPNTEELGLEKAGVKTDDHGYILVNDRLETSAPDIWALGDVKGGPAFTHISYNDYQIVYGNLFEGKKLSTAARIVPYAVYTDPALGRVGLTEKEAREKGYKLKIGKVEMTHVARAIERDETQGLMKIVVDADNDQVLGASILSVEGDEVVQILSTLMLAQKPYTLLKGAIYIHPTLAEGFFTLMESVKAAE